MGRYKGTVINLIAHVLIGSVFASKDVLLVQETFSYDDIAAMSSMQVQVFLNSLLGKVSYSSKMV